MVARCPGAFNLSPRKFKGSDGGPLSRRVQSEPKEVKKVLMVARCPGAFNPSPRKFKGSECRPMVARCPGARPRTRLKKLKNF
jgi:hypothetical protein